MRRMITLAVIAMALAGCGGSTSAPTSAAGLGDKTASSTGVVSWTWKVGTRTTPGSWPVIVGCSKGDLYDSITKNLKVQ